MWCVPHVRGLEHRADGLSEIVDVSGVDSGHGEATVVSAVNVELLSQTKNLRQRQSSVAEHADLICDMVPSDALLLLALLQLLAQQQAHVPDAVRHALALFVPLGLEDGVTEHLGHDAGTVDRRVRVHRTHHQLQLTVDASALLGIAGDQREATHSLTVETEVLGERLTQHDGVTVGDKLANGIGIGFCVARGETLVGAVKEDQVVLLQHQLGQNIPLVLGRIAACGVVRTGMQHEERTILGVLDVVHKALEVDRLGGGIVVLVKHWLQAGIAEQGDVVGPSRIGNIHFHLAEEGLHHLTSQSAATSARNRLRGGDSSGLEGLAVRAIGKLQCDLHELRDPRDTGVLLVHVAVHN
mmetsp:Transcript_45003/g.78580  ORF Transcript_45003/g.78580 Transcript_45003/m.78580 type:complete len:355 (-) Transcript_45003:281-1345(-)